jgi:predicted enzyme related to lactoylglutathione lyase
MKVNRIATALQYCTDREASARWYADFLGVETTPYVATYFKFDEHAYLILGPGAPDTGRGGTGVWFEVDSVDEAYRERVARGYRFNEEPYDIPPGRLVTINDPDGNIIGLIDNSKGGVP